MARRLANTTQSMLALCGAVAVLIAGGIAYRSVHRRWRGTGDRPISLPVPLSKLPYEIAGWVGKDVQIPQTTQQYMRQHFADDYISRRYAKDNGLMVADLYTVYCTSRPAGILGHRPGVCYPANGWIHDQTDNLELVTSSGRRITCLLQRFHRSVPDYQQITVLSFYVVNGQITTHEQAFSGMLDRAPNIAGDPARYVAQVQISSLLESSVRRAASELVDAILEILPDRYGWVSAARK